MFRRFTLSILLLLLLSGVDRSNGFSSSSPLLGGSSVVGITTHPTDSSINKNSYNYRAAKPLFMKRDPIQMPTSTPMVPYKAPGDDYTQFIDIYSRMMRDRTLFIGRYIDSDAANDIISTMLYLQQNEKKSPITLYLNIPGAQMRPALAVYDLIQASKQFCEINTINLGLCAGMGALIAGAGTKGCRKSMVNARFLLQRTGMGTEGPPFRGQASDIGLEVKNLKNWNDRMTMELARLTGQTKTRVLNDMKRDFYLSAQEAVQYGLIDEVLEPSELKKRANYDIDLGTFEGEEEQRYQDQENKGGWGQAKQGTRGPGGPPGGRGDDGDYKGPKTSQDK